MNKIMNAEAGNQQDISQSVYNFAKKIENDKKLQDQIWKSFCMSDANDLTPERSEYRFSPHPKRLSADLEIPFQLEQPPGVVLSPKQIIDSYFCHKKTTEDRTMLLKDETREFMEKTNALSNAKSETLNSNKETLNKRKTESVLNIKENERGQKETSAAAAAEKTEKKNVKKSQNLRLNVYSYENQEERRKMKTLLQKSNDTLTLISNLMECGVDPPDGEEDFMRRKKRCIEFTSRFSRNYLYQLDRIISDLSPKKKSAGCKSPSLRISITQRLLNAQHIIVQALTAYHNHLPSSVRCGQPNKLKELLRKTEHIDEIHLKQLRIVGDKELLNEVLLFEKNASCILATIEMAKLNFKDNNLGKMKQNGGNANGFRPPKSLNSCPDVPFHKKNSLDKRLSMYGAPSSNSFKKSIANLAKKHNFTKSRYKTIPQKHRPPFGNVDSLSGRRFPPARTEKIPGTRASTPPAAVPINEDEIPTMVEMVDNEREEKRDAEKVKNAAADLSAIIPMAEELCSRITKMNQDGSMSQEQIELAIRSLVQTTILTRKCTSSTFNLDNVEKEHQQKFPEKRESDSRKTTKRESVTVIGPKNVQLICINQAEGLSSNLGNSHASKISVQNISTASTSAEPHINKSGAISKTTISHCKDNSSGIRIDRVPKKNKKSLLSMLPKRTVVSIIEYNLKFHEFTRNDPMYSKTNNMKPWDILESISDQLLDDVILSVTREIDVNHILEKLYESEFQ